MAILKEVHQSEECSRVNTRSDFQQLLESLFDTSHRDALAMIKIEEDRQFLLAQREKERRGFMVEVDVALSGKEERGRERLLKPKRRIEAEQRRAVESTVFVVLESSDSDVDVQPENITNNVQFLTVDYNCSKQLGTIGVSGLPKF